MKTATLILLTSVAALSAARAEDANMRSLQFAQAVPTKAEHQPAGACTPIGLTANGDIVFPWECRETIEKQRGPISISFPKPSNDAPSREQASSSDARQEDAVATAAAPQPKAEEMATPAAAPPEVDAASAPAKLRLRGRRASEMGRSKSGRIGQHADALHLASSGGSGNVRKRLALQPAAAPK